MNEIKLDLNTISVESLVTEAGTQVMQQRITYAVNCASYDGCSDYCTSRSAGC